MIKHPLITLALSGIVGGMAATTAHADNVAVENAIRSRPDLSTFYQALVNTGVNHELNESTSYTIFAPTNDAFAKIREDQYPCFYRSECRMEVAEIVRNHIISGTMYMDDETKQKGGIFSIDGRFVNIGEPFRNDYAVDGNNILYTSSFGSGIIYKIDGVIVNPRELASLEYPQYAALPPHVTTTTQQKTIPDPSCGPGGCPDELTETTTVTRTVVEPSTLAPAALAPASR